MWTDIQAWMRFKLSENRMGRPLVSAENDK